MKANPDKYTIRHRFQVTLLSNILRAGLSLLTGIILARGMGPSEYGNLNFFLAIFISALPLIEMGTSSAFYTFISQKRRSKTFYTAYAFWMAFQMLFPCLIIGALFPNSWISAIWMTDSRFIILLALVASFLSNQLWRAIQHIGESARETAFVQRMRLGVSLLHFLLIVTLFCVKALSVRNVLIAFIAEYLLAYLYFLKSFSWSSVIDLEAESNVASIARSFYDYSAPLALSGWMGFAYLFVDRWLLQRFSGSIQQGYFSIGDQFSAIALLFTTSLINIFWKEIAAAHELKDLEKEKRLYFESSKITYFSACLISCFLIPLVPALTPLLLGGKYAGAQLPLALMLFFPAHQSLGQINGSYLFAKGRTGEYFKFTLISMTLSIPAAYFMLAPKDNFIPGLALGSTGLALKTILVQAIVVNIQNIMICRANKWDIELAYQFVSPLFLLFTAYLSTMFFRFSGSNISLIFSLAASFSIYLIVAVVLAWKVPAISGIKKEYIEHFASKIRLALGVNHGN